MNRKIKILINLRRKLREDLIQRIREVSDKIEVVEASSRKEALRAIEDADIVFGWIDRELFLAAKNLKWIQVLTAGVNRLLFPELVESQVLLTNASGIHRIPISEIVMAMALALAKKLHKYIQFKNEGLWKKVQTEELAGKTMGILGLGSIGMETAWKAKCFDMRVLALKKRPIRRPTYIDEVLGPEDLDYLLRESDFLVITVPLTDETYHMIGERELRMMKPTAYLINVARGAIIDTRALIKALKEGWIAGAALDVFEEEPLPKDSELWKLDNVIITPHIAGMSIHYDERAVEIFCKNLKRFLENKPLINLVDKKAGY
ncbi:D-2-hydroxyacid dehydrogenase [Candidatus Bathyarchaeota archaeon]|nr:D-2-hydroxyacid dehydrogenase [Candidatus Bathyarchaeota archaeon]